MQAITLLHGGLPANKHLAELPVATEAFGPHSHIIKMSLMRICIGIVMTLH